MEDDDSGAPTRPSIKTQSPFNNPLLWKHKLRENCHKRVRDERTRLLWQMRSPASQSPGHKDFIRSSFQNIVSDEMEKIKDSAASENLKISKTLHEADDMLWEYGGLRDAYQGECEDILIEMQRIFYEAIEEGPPETEPETNIDTWEEEEDEFLARAVFESMCVTDGQRHKEFLCPTCKHGELREDHQLIVCSSCNLQLSKGDEVDLETLRTRLAEAHEEHLNRGCRLKPIFCIETRFGLTALYICCHTCKIFEIVL